jgi:hypothetical protein
MLSSWRKGWQLYPTSPAVPLFEPFGCHDSMRRRRAKFWKTTFGILTESRTVFSESVLRLFANTQISEEFEMPQDRPLNPSAVDTAPGNAADLHTLSLFGEKAYPFILDKIGEFNTNFKDDPKKLQEIAHIYKQLSKNDPLVANEVQIAADGSLNFFPNKATSPLLRKLEENLVPDFGRLVNDQQNNLFAGDDSDRVSKDLVALREEEKRLVPGWRKTRDDILCDPHASATSLHDTSLLGARANSEMLDIVGRLNVHYQHDPKTLRNIAHMYKELSQSDPLFANQIHIGAGGLLEFIPTKLTSEKLKSLETKIGDEVAANQLNLEFSALPGTSGTDALIAADQIALEREERRLLGSSKA